MLPLALLATQLVLGAADPSPWDAPLPEAAALRRMAENTRNNGLQHRIRTPEERTALEKEFAALAKLEDGARQTSLRAAAVQLAGYGELAHLYHAHALALAPEDPVRVNNFAAMLLLMKVVDPAIPYLRYAEQRAPKDPAILVNLGNAALARREHPRAERYFQAALAVAPQHAEAWLGMGAIWLARNNYPRALEALGKANGISYHPAAGKLTDPPPPPGQKRPPPTQPLEAPTLPGDPGPGSLHVTATTLDLPPLPQWSGPDAFLASVPKRKAFRKEVGKRAAAAMDELMKGLQEVTREARASRQAAKSGGARQVPYLNDFETESALRNDAWLSARLEEIGEQQKKDSEVLAELNERLGRAAEQQKSSGASAACQQGNLEACQKMFVSWCRNLQPLTLKVWEASDAAYRRQYQATTEALETYYRAQAGWIRRVHSQHAWEQLNRQRELQVWSTYSALLLTEEATLWQTIGLAMGSFGKSAESCPDMPPKPRRQEEDPVVPEVARVDPFCPFKNGPLEIPPEKLQALMPLSVSAKLDCKSVELTASGGPFTARYQRTFRSHTRLHFEAEVGGDLEGKEGGALEQLGETGTGLEAKLKGTVDVVLHDDGRVQATTQVSATATARVLDLYEVKVVAGIASDHLVRGSGPPVAVDQE